ncbi:hypothetical protein JCM1841_004736 [Sporobolomyces salmonicolor]
MTMTRLSIPTSASTPIVSLLPGSPAPFQLIWASHSRWPLLPAAAPSSAQTPPQRLTVSVLDSSFNPPHAAHLALAQYGSHDAQLLSFTVGNPDKGVVDSRITALRLEMVREVARDMERRAKDGTGNPAWTNVAVAVMMAPTFVEKSHILQEELRHLIRVHLGGPADDEGGARLLDVRLTFPIGWDTLVRVFAPRYYPPPGPDLAASMTAFLTDNRSWLACARRGDISPEEEQAYLATPEVESWVKQGKVELFDLDENIQRISSTAIRRAAAEGRWNAVERDVPFPRVVEIIKREALYR